MIKPDTDQTLFKFIEDADGKMYKAKKEKSDRRTGKDRRSGKDRREGDRRSLNSPVNLK